MKRLFVLPLLLGLAACDKPTSQVELDCGRAYQNSETKVSAKTYKDKAIIKVNGGEEIILKAKEAEDDYHSISRETFEYEGVIPETNEKVEFDFSLDKAEGIIEYYGINFEKTDSHWNCNVRNKFQGKYNKPSKEALCIEEITRKVFLESDKDVEPGQQKKLFLDKNINEFAGNRHSVKFHSEKVIIPQEDALAISKNWDYNNMKLYSNEDEKIEDHEKDACEVAKKLDQYIKSKGLDKTTYIFKLDRNLLGQYANYSWLKNQDIKKPEELDGGYLDIRSVDCSNKDLSVYDFAKISFDYGTIFPEDLNKMPANFDAGLIFDKNKNPGLNVRKLHEMGIDGSGVSMAIIDQKLSPHWEYNDNLVWYQEEFNEEHMNDQGSMHGAAVASIAVGKMVGVAPKAKLYYFASDLADGIEPDKRPETEEEEKNLRTSRYYARVLYDIIDMNRDLPEDEKIVVVSVSAAPAWSKDPDIWKRALEKAKKAGIFVTTTSIREEYGLTDNGVNRDVYGDPDNPESYSQTYWQADYKPSIEVQKKTLCFPMDHRTTAAPNGYEDYVHYANGGMSWAKPFEAGVYVLAKQVKRDITPEEFFKVGLETGTYSERAKCVLVNPVALIEALRK